MIRPNILQDLTYYYVWGNTPPVCLTQDLPPEQDADILLLGCGDARNFLFTCFADNARKIDVTCCDIQPGIHARNILLYSLLMEDEENANIERIWNIYYHWRLDKSSLVLLETQTEKLLQVSNSIDDWHNSVYGSSIRFCDARSLSLVRSFWVGFSSRGLSRSEKKHRQTQLQAAIKRAKEYRGDSKAVAFGHTSPASVLAIRNILNELMVQWWDCGTMLQPSKLTDLNPALLYSPNDSLTLFCYLVPLSGFCLSNTVFPTTQGSGFRHEFRGNLSSFSLAQFLVSYAKTHFVQWASAFRGAIHNKSVIRIFSGDALAFCCTLRNCQLTSARSMNLFCDGQTNSRLELHHSSYAQDENVAPVVFDVIDTSNIFDYVGPLNLIITASSVLKYHASSTLYTETLTPYDSSLADRLFGIFGVDVHTMSILLGLVLPDLFTNATNQAEDELFIENTQQLRGSIQRRSRLRWKRLQGCESSETAVNVEAKALSKLLAQVHSAMHTPKKKAATMVERFPSSNITMLDGPSVYNQASFALFLYYLQTTVTTDWTQCIKYLCETRLSLDCVAPTAQELLLNMHLFGVDDGTFRKPAATDVHEAVLASVMPVCEKVQDLLCVTVRVSRGKLKVLTRYNFGNPALVCSFEGGDPGEEPWSHSFSAVQVAFGSWCKQTDEEPYPRIQEDCLGLSGTSDMFVSVLVPTWMLLLSKRSVPFVKCGVIKSEAVKVQLLATLLGPDLCFARSEMTNEDVFITHYMPGMSALPTFPPQNRQPSAATAVQLTVDGLKINTLTQRVGLESAEMEAILSSESPTLNVEFKSPLTAVVTISQSLKVKLKFPVPVSVTKYNARVDRKSFYIEIEAPLFDPLAEDAASSFLLPMFVAETPFGAIVPNLWTSTRLDLDAMPPIDLSNKHAVDILILHVSLMFSVRERRIRESKESQVDVRTNLKDQLVSLFMRYMGLQGEPATIFALRTPKVGIRMLILPSCVRLDFVNHTIVLDAAMVPLTNSELSDSKVVKFVESLADRNFGQINVTEADYRAWSAIAPAVAERCRTADTYKHVCECEYIQAGEVPRCEEAQSPICSCGVGTFPDNYLNVSEETSLDLNYIINRYATRVAIAPIFTVPFIEECFLKGYTEKDLRVWGIGPCSSPKDCPRCINPSAIGPIFVNDYAKGILHTSPLKDNAEAKCAKCGRSKGEIIQAGEKGLLLCSRCRATSYCSKKCQVSDWKEHKLSCSA